MQFDRSFVIENVVINMDDELEVTKAGGDFYGIPVGERVRVSDFIDNNGKSISFYLTTNNRHEQLGDPDDFVGEDGWCIKVLDRKLMTHFKKVERGNKGYIKDDYSFRGRNLKGMQCNIITKIDGNAFIEMSENIGGGSCDGIGKTGHCIIVPKNIIIKK